MAAPLTFAVEFATEKAKDALGSLVSTVKSSTVDLAASVLAPISPANLVTQIAQQSLGVNSLAGNLVAGGVGAVAGSRFGYLADMGAQFNAENAAINQTIAEARNARAAGTPMSDQAMDFAYTINYRYAKAQEDEELRFKQRIGRDVASEDVKHLRAVGTKIWNEPEVRRAREYADFYGDVARDALDMVTPDPMRALRWFGGLR